ncbi:MAG: nicotinate (nicotinamide) nucleotide adenylyltransferase [Firmicutes bacterium]|nr:nicotinate (nicotinamide) nucleotide adenylyltransferase [Bacillota bacterium]
MIRLLYGSPFDPIHHGHLAMLKSAQQHIRADEVLLIITKNPRWKNITTNILDRINMVKLAIAHDPSFQLSLYEVEKDAVINFTIHTVQYFKQLYPNDQLYYLIGGDQVEQFHKWKEADKFKTLVQLIAYPRPGSSLDHPNWQRYSIQKMSGPLYPVSSTSIRNLESLATPLPVIQYIFANQLYFVPKLKAFYQPERFQHVYSTASLAYEIALENHQSPEDAFLAAILHDIAKDMDEEEARALLDEYDTVNQPVEQYALHQFVGAILARQEFNIKHDGILEAIRYHTTGKAQMGPLAQIVYAADKIEPTRGYDSSALIAACKKQYHEGFLMVLKENLLHLKKKKHKITNPLVKECMAYYLGENDGK